MLCASEHWELRNKLFYFIMGLHLREWNRRHLSNLIDTTSTADHHILLKKVNYTPKHWFIKCSGEEKRHYYWDFSLGCLLNTSYLQGLYHLLNLEMAFRKSHIHDSKICFSLYFRKIKVSSSQNYKTCSFCLRWQWLDYIYYVHREQSLK